MFNYRQPSECKMAHDQDNPCLSDEDYHRYELTDSMGISCGWCCDRRLLIILFIWELLQQLLVLVAICYHISFGSKKMPGKFLELVR